MKICVACKKNLNDLCFTYIKSKKRFNSRCRDCQSEYHKLYRLHNEKPKKKVKYIERKPYKNEICSVIKIRKDGVIQVRIKAMIQCKLTVFNDEFKTDKQADSFINNIYKEIDNG